MTMLFDIASRVGDWQGTNLWLSIAGTLTGTQQELDRVNSIRIGYQCAKGADTIIPAVDVHREQPTVISFNIYRKVYDPADSGLYGCACFDPPAIIELVALDANSAELLRSLLTISIYCGNTPTVSHTPTPTPTFTPTPTPTTFTPTPTPTSHPPTPTPTPTSHPPTPTPTTTPTNHDGGGFSLCCFLAWAWVVLFVAGWVLGYFGLWWPAAVIAFVASAILTLVWAFVCCWPCIVHFWRCCTFLKWMVFAHILTLSAFAAIAGGGTSAQQSWVWWVVLALGLGWEALHVAANCGVLPVRVDPRTWPSCSCDED
jgi:hypothetical protein